MFRQAKTSKDIIINWVLMVTVVLPVLSLGALGALGAMCYLIMSAFQSTL